MGYPFQSINGCDIIIDNSCKASLGLALWSQMVGLNGLLGRRIARAGVASRRILIPHNVYTILCRST